MGKSANQPDTEPTAPEENLPAIPNLLSIISNHKRKVDVHKAIKLRQKGLSYTEIGKIFNCTHTAVINAIKPYTIVQNEIQSFNELKADILADEQKEILRSITPEDRKKASLLQKITSVGILSDKERRERDLSTENIAHIHKNASYFLDNPEP